MKKTLLRIAQALSILAVVLLGGCTSTKLFQTSYQKVAYLSLSKDVPASQTKGGITVELRTTWKVPIFLDTLSMGQLILPAV